jgi:pimeloyl-ACP methyl ester carboxylesterase
VELPDVRYARSGDVAFAYHVVCDATGNLVFVRGFAGDVLSAREQPLLVHFIEDPAEPTLEARVDGRRAAQERARLATLFAATSPERVAALVLLDPSAKRRRTPDYPWALIDDEWRERLAKAPAVSARWGH